MTRMPVYMLCAMIIVAVNSEDNFYARTIMDGLPSPDLILDGNNGNAEHPDTAYSYILPKLMTKYAQRLAARQWDDQYSLSDSKDNRIDFQKELNVDTRNKRGGMSVRDTTPSLSISNSLDVLRNRLLLEISRKKEMEGAFRNRNLLCKIGKRGVAHFDVVKRRCDGAEKQFIEDKLDDSKTDLFLIN